jgi:non-canonical (house-cleaning) NTP pyrophosphatase
MINDDDWMVRFRNSKKLSDGLFLSVPMDVVDRVKADRAVEKILTEVGHLEEIAMKICADEILCEFLPILELRRIDRRSIVS